MAKRPPRQGEREVPLQPSLEAALFTTARPLSLDELCELLDTSRKAVMEALVALVRHHEETPLSGLEVARSDEGWILQAKGQYQRIVDRLLPSDLPQAILKTLTLIAMRQPILQRDLVELRGSGAYDHVRDLAERGLVRKTPQGNSAVLELGPRFGDYFRIDKDKLAQIQGQTTISWPAASTPEDGSGEADAGRQSNAATEDDIQPPDPRGNIAPADEGT